MHSKVFSIFFRVVLSATLLYVIFWRVEAHDVFLYIQNIDFFYFFFSLVLVATGSIIAALRWFYILRAWDGDTFLFKNILSLSLISFFYSLFVPGGQAIGEAVKGYRISSDASNKAQTLYSIIADRLIGFIALFPLLLIAFLSIAELRADFLSMVAIMASATVAFLSVLLLVSSWIARGIIKFIFFLVSFLRKRAAIFSYDIMPLRRYALGVFGLGVLNHIMMGLSVFILARGIGIDTPFFLILWVYLISGVLSFPPISYAGFGPRELAFVYFLGLAGVVPAQALAVSLLFASVNILFALVGFFLELKFLFVKRTKAP